MGRPWYRLDGHLGQVMGRHQVKRWRPKSDFRSSTLETMCAGYYSTQALREAHEEEELATVYFLRHQLNLCQTA